MSQVVYNLIVTKYILNLFIINAGNYADFIKKE
jgi:hypothetical protein